MNVEDFINVIGAEFYVGVPDSFLSPLCDYLVKNYGTNNAVHIVAANEGNAVAIGAGYNLASSKFPVVYMQNSGEGNAINPITSLISNEVYSIPMIFIIGWRGEPNFHDEPQHIFQGKVTLPLLDLMTIPYAIIDKNFSPVQLKETMNQFNKILKNGRSVAFVIKKGALTFSEKINYHNENLLPREDAINCILEFVENDILVSTTGKISRELFELREMKNQTHAKDFLTVGSMGHSSSIALGIALQKPNKKIWCIDGDGAAILHMGALAVIGNIRPKNFIHIVLNNEAHESVGGVPTSGNTVNFIDVAKACGYEYVKSVNSIKDLTEVLNEIKLNDKLQFIEVKVSLSSRKNLGRPTISPLENKKNFINILSKN